MSLHDLILRQIQTFGSISVHDYMQLCLQHPEYGYYRKSQAIGAEGDFITAPEISQIFGDLLGLWLIHAWQVGGMPSQAALVELGPGRGTLAADIMRICKKNPQIRNVFHLHLVESNHVLREQQARQLWHYQPIWHDNIESLPSDIPLFIIANEFFDALPIRQFIGNTERQITLAADGSLHFIPKGIVTHEDSPSSLNLMHRLCSRLRTQSGCLLIVDYGYTAPEKNDISSERISRDTLQALKSHEYHSVLASPGEIDLTAHVDFGSLATIAQSMNMVVHGPVMQGIFLQRIGGDIWLQKLLGKTVDAAQRNSLEQGWLRLVSPLQMGSLFKVMAITPFPAQLAGMR